MRRLPVAVAIWQISTARRVALTRCLPPCASVVSIRGGRQQQSVPNHVTGNDYTRELTCTWVDAVLTHHSDIDVHSYRRQVPECATYQAARRHRSTARRSPSIIMMFRQNGEEAKGWRGAPFWWPAPFPPLLSVPAAFAASVKDVLMDGDEDDDD